MRMRLPFVIYQQLLTDKCYVDEGVLHTHGAAVMRVRAMPRWSIPILWYPDSAITSLYQPVLTPVPLGDSASKAWSLLDNAYPQQDSALANARASLPLGTDI